MSAFLPSDGPDRAKSLQARERSGAEKSLCSLQGISQSGQSGQSKIGRSVDLGRTEPERTDGTGAVHDRGLS